MGFNWKATGVGAALALLAVACNDIGSPTRNPTPRAARTVTSGTQVDYSGQGFTGGVLNTSFCETPNNGGTGVTITPGDPYLLWVLTANGASAATLYGLPGGPVDMVQVGGTFKLVTAYYSVDDLKNTYHVYALYAGTANNAQLVVSHGCDGGGGGAKGSSVVTEVHLADHSVIDNTVQGGLGVTVHDSATVTTDGNVEIPDGSKVTFHFWNNNSCDGVPVGSADEMSISGASPGGARSSTHGPLGAGEYSFQADFTSGDNTLVSDSEGLCEPFKIKKADTETSTQVHDAAHHDITNTTVATGTTIHDYAAITGGVTGFDITGTVTFKFFNNSACSGDPASSETVDLITTDESTPQTIAIPGSYAYSAKYNGDDNYNASANSDCEPLTVIQLGKTMGFWGNTNGIATITKAGGYSNNAVAIGRGSNVDTQGEAAKILPNTLNACGKGSPAIFTVGASTSSANCTLATGVNIGTLNTNSAQTLALGYNIKLVTNYSGQTIGALGCSAYQTAGVTASKTVNDAFAAAVILINGSASGGSTKQGDLGAMNQLLNCLNREAI